MVELVDDVLWTQYLIHIGIIQYLHFWWQADAVAHWIDFILELKLHLTKVIILLVDVLLWADFLDALGVLEHGFNNLLVVLQAFLGQWDIHIEVGVVPEFVVAAGRELIR